MDSIRRQVRRARRRLVLQQFLGVLGWVLAAALVVAVAALTTTKIWAIPVAAATWTTAWITGSLAAGLLVAVAITWTIRRNWMDAAIEIDRRFGLKERVSSSLSLHPGEEATEMGSALLADVARCVADLDVRERFQVRAPWSLGLPLLPALLVFVLAMLVPDAAIQSRNQAQAATETAKIVKKETDRLRQELQKKHEQLEQQGLEDAEELLKQLQQAVDDLQAKSDVDRKQAMIKLNDMAKIIAERQKQLAGPEQLREQLNKLQDLQPGPADRLAQALRQGNFQGAAEELKKLQKRLETGQMTDDEKKQLAEQLSSVQKKVEEIKQAYEQAKRDLQEEIRQKQQAGDYQAASELQKKLDQLNRASGQMSRMDQIAQSLGQTAKSLQSGDSAAASRELAEATSALDQMQGELQQLETLDEMLDSLAACKDGLCEGEGQEGMDGNLAGNMSGSSMSPSAGRGLGDGQGQGERPEDPTETGGYESRVRGKLQPGKAAVAGTADGPNVAGQSREATRAAIRGEIGDKADPLTDERLPRDQRDHAREYFQRFLPDRQ